MTPSEFFGTIALGAVVGQSLALLIKPKKDAITSEIALRQVEKSVCRAFQAGMLCAADIATFSGNEKLAGDIRKTVEYIGNESNTCEPVE